MKQFIDTTLTRAPAILIVFYGLIFWGIYIYITIPKESSPDIKLPFVGVSVEHRGISPEDAEKLLIKPIEEEIFSLSGLKEVKSYAYEGGASLLLEFIPDIQIKDALVYVREKVNLARSKLPKGTKEPSVEEKGSAFFPILVAHLSSNMPPASLLTISKKLSAHLTKLRYVLTATLIGEKDDIVEIFIDPLHLESYRIPFHELYTKLVKNHTITPSGALHAGKGSFVLKTPGLLNTAHDIGALPIRSTRSSVVRISDIATAIRTHEIPKEITHSRGSPSFAIEVMKRTGENILDTITAVKDTVHKFLEPYKDLIHVEFSLDKSQQIYEILRDLQNNLITALVTVMIMMLMTLGRRSAVFVGLAIPTSFLSGLIVLHLLDVTLNIVVLFSLILSIGLLVDGAIIIVEYADRRMRNGIAHTAAYKEAATRMFWPVITSIATVIVVFLPLLYWPGILGKFMKYLPLTLVATLLSSLVVAIFFIPALGYCFGKRTRTVRPLLTRFFRWLERQYLRLLLCILKKPKHFIVSTIGALCALVFLFYIYNAGTIFFPRIEPNSAAFLIKGHANMSIGEKEKQVRTIESYILGVKEFSTVYTVIGSFPDSPADVIGKITVELIDWQKRDAATTVLNRVQSSLPSIPGISVELRLNKMGPSKAKDLVMDVSGPDISLVSQEASRIRRHIETLPSLQDIDDTQPRPGIEWHIDVHRDKAAFYGLTIDDVGAIIQMMGQGVRMGSYRPVDTLKEVFIFARFPAFHRTLYNLHNLRVYTSKGSIPLEYFADIKPHQRRDKITRVNGLPTITITANLLPGILLDTQIAGIRQFLTQNPLQKNVAVTFKGEERDKQDNQIFLGIAFILAIVLVGLMLVIQFNSVFDATLTLSSVLFAISGVLLGLLILHHPFNIVMGGISIIALSGIIVSNNIIFIDTFSTLRKKLPSARTAVIKTGISRLRPILLTQLTTLFGLLPAAFRINIDFFSMRITQGAPSSDWWVDIAINIIFGVSFASLLTLTITPCALLIHERKRRHIT